MKIERLDSIHNLRGLAVISVVIFHYFSNFFMKEANQVVGDLMKHTGVAIFFLISGFVIPASLENLKIREFIVRRFFRIYPVLFVALALGGLLAIEFKYHDMAKLLGFVIISLWISKIRVNNFVKTLMWLLAFIAITRTMKGVWSALLIYDLIDSSPQLLGVIWTLAIEVHFYLLCGLAFYFSQKINIKFFAIILGVLLIGASISESYLVTVAQTNLLMINLMLVGTSLYMLHKNQKEGVICLFVTFCFLILIKTEIQEVWIFSFGVALLLFVVFLLINKKSAILSFFANISYPLYLIHYQIFSFVGKAKMEHMMQAGLSTLLSIVAAYYIHQLFETKFIDYSKNLTARNKIQITNERRNQNNTFKKSH